VVAKIDANRSSTLLASVNSGEINVAGFLRRRPKHEANSPGSSTIDDMNSHNGMSIAVSPESNGKRG